MSYLILTIERPEPFHFQAGQHTTLRSVEDPLNARSYSIAGMPGTDTLEFCIQTHIDGHLIPLAELSVGDAVELGLARGKFLLRDGSRNLVFVAGGSGIGPLRPLLLTALHQSARSSQIKLFYGCRLAAEFPYREEFAALQSQFPNRLKVLFTAESGETDWAKLGNPVDILNRPSEFQHTIDTKAHYYLCGPPPMIQAAKKALATHVSNDQIFTEFP